MSKHTLYVPRSDENPWRRDLDSWLTIAEWKEISRWYPFSLRSLMYDGRWYEHGRYGSRDQAYSTMRLRAESRRYDYYVIVHCTLIGKAGREKAVVFSGGSEQTILAERRLRLAEAGFHREAEDPLRPQPDREQEFRQLVEGLLEIAAPGNVKASLWSRYQELTQEEP